MEEPIRVAGNMPLATIEYTLLVEIASLSATSATVRYLRIILAISCRGLSNVCLGDTDASN